MLALHNLHIINEPGKSIYTDHERICSAGCQTSLRQLYFDHCIAFPGLINSHDHLDFDLFPQLGNRVYKDHVEWGKDIHAANKPAIDAVLQVPRNLRVKWGVYKNLLAGITTVVHHGHYVEPWQEAPIGVFQDCNMLHSIQLGEQWRRRLNNPLADRRPWVLHIGEGTNAAAHKEIDRLIRWNIFRRKLIGVHGVALDNRQARSFDALIWCPDSNFFLLGTTARIDQLKAATKIIFGTDSTLSAHWNIFEQLRAARRTGLLTDEELFHAVTTIPASVWHFEHTGAVKTGMFADLVVAKQKDTSDWDAFFAAEPEDIQLVLKKGAIALFDGQLLEQLHFNNEQLTGYSKVYINGTCKYVAGDLPALVHAIQQYAPGLAFPVQV